MRCAPALVWSYPPDGALNEPACGFNDADGVFTLLAKGGSTGQLHAWCVPGWE